MHVRIRAAHGAVEVSADDEDVAFRLAGREVAIVWSEITGAGLARPASVPIQFPRHEKELLPGRPREVDIVPFGNRLAGLARGIHATHRALVVAYGAGKSFQVFLPTQDPGTERLVEEFRSRLGQRWFDRDLDLRDLRKQVGIGLGWGGRALGLVFVVVVGVGGLLAIVGWAGLIRAAEEGDFSLLQAYTLIPLALWCVLVWYLLRRFRFTRG
ncbi:MAG: hypothetical protein ACRDMK_02755 [Gaiellaceae bacterium]